MATVITFIGLTGTGKSTVAQETAKALSLPLISSGDIAREIAESDTYARAGLDRGDWAPEIAIRTEVVARIEAAMATAGDCVLEGFPRRIEQLVILEKLPVCPLYVVLECSPLVCIRRLIARGRHGDHPDAIALRLRHYAEFTQPVVDALYDESVELNALRTVEDSVAGVIRSYRKRSP